jgi:eukaryotic-like serine/threonine-protein kinase
VRFRPGGLVVGPGRATRRGYQRAAGPPQSTGGDRSRATGSVRAYRPVIMLPRRRYLLADPVGVGGMGTVWRAWDRHERRWVAAKLRRPSGPDDAASVERFVRERALRVRHRHVVQPAGRAARDDLFTMDLVRGGDVEQLLERHGPLPDSYVRVVLDQVLQALVAVHAAGLVHRDVKPGNLLLEPTGTGRPWVRLGDFGIAVRCDDPRLTRAPGGVGTGGYMPPEQVAGAPPDPRQDVYAAGVVATQLLTGGPPGGPAPDTPLGRLLASFTDPEPERRPATAAAALVRLRALGIPAGAPWQAGPDPPDVRALHADPPARTPYAWAVLGVFAAAGLLGGLGSWVLLR